MVSWPPEVSDRFCSRTGGKLHSRLSRSISGLCSRGLNFIGGHQLWVKLAVRKKKRWMGEHLLTSPIFTISDFDPIDIEVRPLIFTSAYFSAMELCREKSNIVNCNSIMAKQSSNISVHISQISQIVQWSQMTSIYWLVPKSNMYVFIKRFFDQRRHRRSICFRKSDEWVGSVILSSFAGMKYSDICLNRSDTNGCPIYRPAFHPAFTVLIFAIRPRVIFLHNPCIKTDC